MSDTPHADTDEAARANADTQGPADAQEAADAKPTKRLSPRAKLILLVLLAAVVVLSVLWYLRYESHGKFMQDTNDATIQADAVTVAPKVSGYVADVLVGDNQDVKGAWRRLAKENHPDVRPGDADAAVRFQAVRDDKRGAVLHQPFQRLLHDAFGLPVQYRGKLPAQVVRVLDRAVEAEPAGRRMPVCGVADEEHPAATEPFGEHPLHLPTGQFVDVHRMVADTQRTAHLRLDLGIAHRPQHVAGVAQVIDPLLAVGSPARRPHRHHC